MIASLRQFWSLRSTRDRVVVVVLALSLLGSLYIYLMRGGQGSYARLREAVASLRLQDKAVAQQAAEIGRLRLVPPAPASATDLKVLVDGLLGAAGLSPAVERLDATQDDRVVVSFGAISFAAWLHWVDGLAAHQLRVEACRIEALAAPGSVAVSATLVRAGSS